MDIPNHSSLFTWKVNSKYISNIEFEFTFGIIIFQMINLNKNKLFYQLLQPSINQAIFINDKLIKINPTRKSYEWTQKGELTHLSISEFLPISIPHSALLSSQTISNSNQTSFIT